MVDLKKVVWAYLIRDGNQTLIRDGAPLWNYYGGDFEESDSPIHFEMKEIDLYRTEIPRYDQRGEFVGTDCESATKDVLYGILYLKDGTEIGYGLVDPNSAILDMLQEHHIKEPRDFVQEANILWDM